MARNYPADARMQHFLEEQYTKEAAARLQFHAEQKAGITRRQTSNTRLTVGLPQINPMEFALRKKREEEEALRQIIEEARRHQTTEEMRSVDQPTKNKLYDGFSHEGKGRSQYLRNRQDLSPEAKFTFPLLSSWEYGWKIRDEMSTYGRPVNARTATIKDSFYTRNGVSTLSSADPPHMASRYVSRSYTFG
jgi:hypothetical protein